LHRQGWLTTAIAAQVGCSCAPSSAICACPRGPYGSTAATTGGASSIPIRTISSRAGMLGATPPSNSFVSSNRGATPGAIAAVAAYGSRIRQAQGVPPRRQGRRQTLPVVAEPASQPLTPRRATWLVLRREAQRTEAEPSSSPCCAPSRPRSPRRSISPQIRHAGPPAATGTAGSLVGSATASALEAMQRFANGLRDDYAAVKAGVTLPWSTGPSRAYQSPQNGEAPDVWPRPSGSPPPPLRGSPTRWPAQTAGHGAGTVPRRRVATRASLRGEALMA